MLPSKELINKNSMIIYELLAKMKKCSFNEIQSFCKLDNVCTCLSLINLIKSDRVQQVNTPDGVIYILAGL